MRFVGKLALKWERVSQRFMKKLVGEWKVSAYLVSGDIHSNGKVSILYKQGELIVKTKGTMRAIRTGRINHLRFNNGDGSFLVQWDEFTFSNYFPLAKGATYRLDFSLSVGGV